MAVSSNGELFAALGSGAFERILGTSEDDQCDFKREPYRLDDDAGKWELAKDVAAFANHGGGCIVIGFKTERKATELVETATILRRVPKDLIDAEKYAGVIAGWVYPQVKGLRFHWFPPAVTEANGIFVIEVPAQEETDKLFLVRRMLMDGSLTGSVGLPRREGARVVWLMVEELHRLVLDGRRFSSQMAGHTTSHAVPDRERADGRIALLESLDLFADTPVYLLQALAPTGPDILPGFYSSGGVRGALERIDSLWPSGFNLDPLGNVSIREGALTSIGGQKRDIWLDHDGLFTVLAPISENFLGWGLNQHLAPDRPIRINSIALVEFTLEFCRFLHRHLVPVADSTKWTLRLVCRRMQKPRPVALAPGLWTCPVPANT